MTGSISQATTPPPAFNGEFLEKHPEIQQIMDKIAPLLTDQVLMDLNYKVDVVGREPADVAFEWMVGQGLVSNP